MPVLEKSTVTLDQKKAGRLTFDIPDSVIAAGLVQYVYQDSPIMSTYLLAFIVGEFDYISARTPRGVEVKMKEETQHTTNT